VPVATSTLRLEPQVEAQPEANKVQGRPAERIVGMEAIDTQLRANGTISVTDDSPDADAPSERGGRG